MAEEYKEWSMPKGGLKEYEMHFAPLLQGRTFKKMLNDFRTIDPDKPVLVADIAGYGFVLNELEADRSLAVALGSHPEAGDVDMVIGDMFSEETWYDVFRWCGSDRFALMFCKPVGAFGFRHLISLEDYDFLIGNGIKLLDDMGHFFIQIPMCMMGAAEDLAKFIKLKYFVKVNIPSEFPISAFEICF